MAEGNAVPEYRMLGVRVHALTVDDWLAAVDASVTTRERCLMVGQNLHSVYLVHHDEGMRSLQERATYVRVDGLPLVTMARLLGIPLAARHRSGFMDLAWRLFAAAESGGWRVFYLGARPETLTAGLAELRRRYPRLALTGAHGHFDATPGGAEDSARLAAIAAFAPDLLIVGMGMPRQERWMLAHLQSLAVPAIVASGAALDYIAGSTPMAPRWLSALGLEWVYRLASEPRRLWRRYLLEPWFVLGLLIRDVAGRVVGRPASRA